MNDEKIQTSPVSIHSPKDVNKPDALEPCPFCGEKDITTELVNDVLKAQCTNCSCETDNMEWNIRTAPVQSENMEDAAPAWPEIIEELKSRLEDVLSLMGTNPLDYSVNKGRAEVYLGVIALLKAHMEGKTL